HRRRRQAPRRRTARYSPLNGKQLRQTGQVPDDVLKKQDQDNIQQYQVANRVHVAQIVFKTYGKTDAEVDEIKKRAEDVLKQARKGVKFDELAKKYSEDAPTKDKGGDLGWIGQKQTVPEFEKAAFSAGVGQVSDLMRRQY